MSSNHCGETDHRFAKFDDATIFCRRCGEQRVMDVQALIAHLPTITYLPCPHPHWTWPTWTPTPWWGTTITNGTVSTGVTTVYATDANSSYTVMS